MAGASVSEREPALIRPVAPAVFLPEPLTPEQHLRRALIDSMPRDALLQAIVGHIRMVARKQVPNNAPRDWYGAAFGPRTPFT